MVERTTQAEQTFLHDGLEPRAPLSIKSAAEFKAKYSQLEDEVQIEHHANVTQLDYAFGLLMKSLDDYKLQ